MSPAAATEPGGVLMSIRSSGRAVRVLLLGAFVNQLGAFVQVFLVLFLIDHGAGEGRAGLALGAYGLGSVLGSLLGGRLADRVGRRTTMTLSMLCAAGLTIAIGLLGSPNLYPLLLLVVFTDGAMTQAYRPAALAMFADLVAPERLVMTFSMYRVALNTGAVVGPLLAAWLMTISWDLLFWADGLTAIACALMVRRWLPCDAAHTAAPHGAPITPSTATRRRDDRVGARYGAVLRDRRYMLYLFAMFASSAIYTQEFTALPLKIRAEGHPELVYSAILALSAAIVITCELLVTKRVQTWRATSASVAGIALLALGLGAYGLHDGVVLLVVATLIGTLGQIVSGPTMFAHPARVAPAAARGSYAGASMAMFGLGCAVGPLLGAIAWGAIGNGVFAACAAVGVLAAVAAAAGMRDDAASPSTAEPRLSRRRSSAPLPTATRAVS